MLYSLLLLLQSQEGVLSRVPGIGPKTARAIVFHLRDKLAAVGPEAILLLSDDDAQVIDALTALGFSIVEAQSALQHLTDEDISLEEKVRQALAYLAPG